jgi:hypothetical protein
MTEYPNEAKIKLLTIAPGKMNWRTLYIGFSSEIMGSSLTNDDQSRKIAHSFYLRNLLSSKELPLDKTERLFYIIYHNTLMIKTHS